MKILVLGGTGAIGMPLVGILAAQENDLYVTTRRGRIAHKKNIHYITGNAQEIDFMRELLEQSFDVIIDFMVYDSGQFRKRMNLLLENTKQYIFFSSARVFADTGEKLITEKSKRLLDTIEDETYLETDEYALAKAREENLLQDSIYRNWTIVRPYITYNKERLQLGVMEKETWLQRALEGKTIVFSKDIGNKYTTLTYGGDVASRIAGLVGKAEALGEVFNITTAQTAKWTSILEIYLDALEEEIGRKPNICWQDNAEMISRICHNQYQIKYDRLYDRRFDNSKIQKMMKKEMSYIVLEDGLKQCIREFVENEGEFRERNWKLEGAFDKVTRDRTSIFSIIGMKNKIKYILYRYLM